MEAMQHDDAMAAAADSHGLATKFVHWGVALTIVAAWLLGVGMDVFPRGAARSTALEVHMLFGLTVLTLAVLRVVWRLAAPLPATAGPPWMTLAARADQWALYVFSTAVPVAGLLYRWARPGFVMLPLGWTIPAPFAVADWRMWGSVHATAAYLLAGLVGVHVAAALFHHLVLRDGILRRMVPLAIPLPALPLAVRNWIAAHVRLPGIEPASSGRH